MMKWVTTGTAAVAKRPNQSSPPPSPNDADNEDCDSVFDTGEINNNINNCNDSDSSRVTLTEATRVRKPPERRRVRGRDPDVVLVKAVRKYSSDSSLGSGTTSKAFSAAEENGIVFRGMRKLDLDSDHHDGLSINSKDDDDRDSGVEVRGVGNELDPDRRTKFDKYKFGKKSKSESHFGGRRVDQFSSTGSLCTVGLTTTNKPANNGRPNGRKFKDYDVRSVDICLNSLENVNSDEEDPINVKHWHPISRSEMDFRLLDVSKSDSRSESDFIMVDDSEFNGTARFMKMRGSDPLLQTARGKLQGRRSKLNDLINRELRLRAGAENLYKATSNKKLRDTVAVELSCVNSNVQLLKEELADLNSSVDIYQSSGVTQSVPMIPLGLKETKDGSFKPQFRKFIEEHYDEDPDKYDKEIQSLHDLRQACRTPMRTEEGVELLFSYYNQLYFVDKRMFPLVNNVGVYFEWYDSMTGVPCSQRTVGFEKGSILFNIAALYTQIGARQDRDVPEGIASAIENFQKAAGTFQYLASHFSHAPSTDMQAPALSMLQQLMLAQAQECVFERKVVGGLQDSMKEHIDTAREAAMVAHMYKETQKRMAAEAIREYVPFPWVSMVEVKQQYYRAVSHFYAATAVLDQADSADVDLLAGHFPDLHIWQPVRKEPAHNVASSPPKDGDERKTFARAHLRQSIVAHEDALRVHGKSRQLRRIDTFQQVLKNSHDRSLKKFSDLEEEDDFSELVSVPDVKAKTDNSLHVVFPDFSAVKVTDLFNNLGPLAIFSAHNRWSKQRQVDMKKGENEEFGFSVRGDSPVIVAAVEEKSLAEIRGLKVGDFIVAVGDQDIKWHRHDEIVGMIRAAGSHIGITVVTPLDKNYVESSGGKVSASTPTTPLLPVRMQGPATLERNKKHKYKLGSAWSLRKRSVSRDKSECHLVNGNDTSGDNL